MPGLPGGFIIYQGNPHLFALKGHLCLPSCRIFRRCSEENNGVGPLHKWRRRRFRQLSGSMLLEMAVSFAGFGPPNMVVFLLVSLQHQPNLGTNSAKTQTHVWEFRRASCRIPKQRTSLQS